MDGIDVAVSRVKERVEKVLLIAYFEARNVPSIVENIALVQKLSRFPISILNLAEHRVDMGYLKIPAAIDLNHYDVVIIHNTVAYNVDNLRSLDARLDMKFANYDGVKIVFKQDEHYRFAEFADFARSIGVDCVFSIMPPEEVAKTYGALMPNASVQHMLTSYVTQEMRARFTAPGSRSIDIGYRGSIMPLSFGRLCYQKRRIGDDVSRILRGRGLVLDISSRWEDRVGGDAWFDFLRSCKAVLGVESGSGIFDLDGTLEANCQAIEQRLGADDGSSAYAESYLAALDPIENRVRYYMISPRHFEAIATGTVQLLFPGTYTGRMVAGRHYFELKEDYSNLDEAVALVLNEDRRQAMAQAAYEEVLLDERNWIETFVREVDTGIERELERKGRRRQPIFSAQRDAKNVLLIQAHNFGLDPRRDHWYSDHSPTDVLIHQLGIIEPGREPIKVRRGGDELVLNVPLNPWTTGCLDRFAAQTSASSGARAALRELYFIAYTLTLSDAELLVVYGTPQNEAVIANFRWYLSYVLNTANTLLQAASDFEGIHCLVAINFPSLIPGLILKDLLGVPVIYEALEYWPEADPDQGQFAANFWFDLERRLIVYADHCGTVSPPLARLMTERFGVPFYAVPNCSPRSAAERCAADERAAAPRGDEPVRFLFQGNFAPHRGLESLIRAWAKVDSRAVLILRGPERPFKKQMMDLAQSLGLGPDRISFPEPVDVDDLVRAARSDADVGIVPYPPAGTNYANCSPNKLGQYLAAGLPILANETSFVKDVVRDAACGFVIKFENSDHLVRAVGELCDGNVRRRLADNSARHFETAFHWEAVSGPFYDAVLGATSTRKAQRLSSRVRLGSTSAVHDDAESRSRRWLIDRVSNRHQHVEPLLNRPNQHAIASQMNKLVIDLLDGGILKDDEAAKEKLQQVLTQNKFFDPGSYLAINTDVRDAGVDPGLHYVNYGAREGRLPFEFLRIEG